MIDLEGIRVAYDGKTVIGGLSLTVAKGEFFTLLGPSGCGKTTLLRVISGFVRPDIGRVRIDGRDVTRLSPEERGIGIVFQNYALFPHLTVFENVAFGLRVAGRPRATIASEVARALERVGVQDHAGKKPDALSGGQQQRVAIARALILGAEVLLLDEPLSNLDAKMRDTMRDEIRALQRRLGLTAVYVTHDQQEALAMSDRVAVMRDGGIEQVGGPRAIYHRPQTEFVCTFIGEASRLSPGTLAEAGAADLADRAGTDAVYVRPEAVMLGARTGPDWLVLTAGLQNAVFRGSRVRLVLSTANGPLLCDADGQFPDMPADTPVTVSIQRESLFSFGGGRP